MAYLTAGPYAAAGADAAAGVDTFAGPGPAMTRDGAPFTGAAGTGVADTGVVVDIGADARAAVSAWTGAETWTGAGARAAAGGQDGPAGTPPAWSVLGWLTVPGSPTSVPAVRDYLARLLDQQPDAGTTVLLASELVANSVLHSDSRRDGGTVTVTVLAALSGALRIEVTDQGGATVPLVRDPASLAPGGRGLRLVDALSARWGFYQAEAGTVTWFEAAG